jgi:hypothetical protein
MKKVAFGLLVIVLALLLSANVAMAKEKVSWNPLDAIWKAIAQLQHQYGHFVGQSGPQGPAGQQGLKGDTGSTGPQGPIGLTGPQGVPGLIGPKGDIGPAGPQGIQGESGVAVATFHLYDAGGQDLGLLVSSDKGMNNCEVYSPSLDAKFAFIQGISTDPMIYHVELAIKMPVLFSNENCTGDPYQDVLYNGGIMPQSVVMAGNRFFKVTDFLTDQLKTKSTLNVDGRCINGESAEKQRLIGLEEISLPFAYPPAGPLRIVNQ